MKKNLNSHKGDSRRFERRPYGKAIDCFLDVIEVNDLKKLEVKADAIDVSKEGICIETDYPLEQGRKIKLSDGTKKSGVVKWCMKIDNAYRSGIKLESDRNYLNDSDSITTGELLSVSEEKEKYTRLLNKAIDLLNNRLADIERRCSNEKEDPERLVNETEKALIDMSPIYEEFEEMAGHDKSIIKNAQTEFRQKTNTIMSKSYFMNRARTWPQGYQGDYKTLEGIYRKVPLSEGIGYYLDLCFLKAPLAEAVRNRLRKLGEVLREELIKREEPSVLNIACGSCRELMGLSPEINNSGARFICVDNDSDAINFAQSRLSYAGILSQVELYKYNAHRMFDYELNMMEFGMQDIIYSVGYFDYLPDDFLSKMLNALYRLLKKGGKLIAAFKDADSYRHYDYHWLVDWDGFLQRTKDDFDGLFKTAGIPDHAISAAREESGVIIFYTAIK